MRSRLGSKDPREQLVHRRLRQERRRDRRRHGAVVVGRDELVRDDEPRHAQPRRDGLRERRREREPSAALELV